MEPLDFVVRMTTNSGEAVWVYIVELHCISTHHNVGLMSNILKNISKAERNRLSIPCHLIVSLENLLRNTNDTKKRGKESNIHVNYNCWCLSLKESSSIFFFHRGGIYERAITLISSLCGANLRKSGKCCPACRSNSIFKYFCGRSLLAQFPKNV